MNILAVIPARYASKRFPGKPLANIGERPMVQWVYEAAQSCEVFSHIAVATDDERIAEAVRQFGGAVAMTRSDHPTGTDRVAEVAQLYPDADVIVNVQGDQPFVTSDMLGRLVSPYINGEEPDTSTLACPLRDTDSFSDPNTVKVICDRRMHAIYFSRASIPYFREQCEVPVYHHLGLYAFTAEFLRDYARLEPTPLETCEQLEQLRVLENGFSMRVSLVDAPVLEVNTPEELEAANKLVSQSPL